MKRRIFSDEKIGSAFAVYQIGNKKVEELINELCDDGYEIEDAAVSVRSKDELDICRSAILSRLEKSAALLIFKPGYDSSQEGFELLASVLAERAAEINIPVALVVIESPDAAVDRSAVRKIRDALRLCRKPNPRPQRPERPAMPDIDQVRRIAELTGVPEDDLIGYAMEQTDGED